MYSANTTTHRSRNDQQDYESYAPDEHNYSRYPPYSQQRREPSDASVEALDLADYARTLRPPRRHIDDDYLDPHRPPSLISRVDTLSSTTHSSSRARSTRRPFSLPPQPHSSLSHGPSPYRYNSNYPDEADIAQFPSWSRDWYNSNSLEPRAASPNIYSPLPSSRLGSKKHSPFDPGNFDSVYQFSPPHSSLSHSNRPSASFGHDSNTGREYLPWSSDPPEYGQVIDDNIKEERIRMLEREFGPNAKSKSDVGEDGEFLDENGKPLIGTVDSKGYLVTQGPKKRTATRVVQIMLALAAAIPSIYAALMIKPKETPPPSGTAAARKRGPAGSAAANNPLANGMMVLPVQGLPGGKKDKKKAGKGKKGKGGMMPGGDVQVNLIVDPSIFGGRREEEEEEEDEERGDEWEWERGSSSMPGGFGSNSGNNRKKKRRAKRRSIFVGLAMEEEWKKARKWAKQITAVDSFGTVIWGAVFVFILIGKRCPAGGFDGCLPHQFYIFVVKFLGSLGYDVNDKGAQWRKGF
ncbi:hypothetical protein D9758_000691 [Tetrapyrgos nigripes]|uniref:Uncharacterized protein n=1 Tax=Tetrapyrgos nigripes TaxID=182062 RepID=A0A8H5GZE8_9AGAR|nr:hypothetical protein D9758_000691 [Tetrapyrgos nigripes]